MNDTAVTLGMKGTNYAVAHGMWHEDNYSTAKDVAVVSRHTLAKHDLFRDVVNTKNFQCPSRTKKHTYSWENTNFLLWDKSGTFFGVKTGITPAAGPCLSVHYRSKCGTFDFIVVVLNCKTREARFTEVPKLIEWAQNKITRVRKMNYKPSLKRQLLRNLAHL